MSVPPALDRAVLLEGLADTHGLNVTTAEFIAAGTLPAFRVDGPDGRYFVKVVPGTPSGMAARARLGGEASLLRALRHLGLLPHVPRPVPTLEGEDLGQVSGYGLLVQCWIDAVPHPAEQEAATADLVTLLGRLHAGTPDLLRHIERLPVPPEDFELPFERDLLADLDALNALERGAREGVRSLRELLASTRDLLRRTWHLAHEFQLAARARPRPFVVCHTDAHGGNVMRDATGNTWIIDWEMARLAPREHDLWMLRSRLRDALPTYESGFGRPVELDRDLLGFYVCRRVLEDLAVDVHAILHENTRPEEDEATLGVIERFVLPAFERVLDDLSTLGAH